jgi:cytochrome c-type biogenesis protein CcmH/NrfG
MKTTPSTSLPRFDRLLQRAVLDLEMHREDEAVLKLREALGMKPSDPDAWFWLGRAYEELGRMKDAAYCFNLGLLSGRRHEACRQSLERLGWFPQEKELS